MVRTVDAARRPLVSVVEAKQAARVMMDRVLAQRSMGGWRDRTMRPAVTSVAAWIRDETGAGPSIASGSHMWVRRKIDLVTAAKKSMFSFPNCKARNRQTSPPTAKTNAFFALVTDFGLFSSETSNHEATPSPSQQINAVISDSESTKPVIESTKRLNVARKLFNAI